jgi:PAS domain S-box-containing protein
MSEEKIRNLANIVESSYDAIITVSLEGYITSWNKSAEQVYGYLQEEILGKPISFVAPPHLSDETKKLIERIMQGESVYNYETVRIRKDGKLINISLTLSPVFDFHGKITAASAISRDITENKVSEEKLRESEEKYRNIVETANEGIVIINEQFKTSYVNQKMADMVGYSVEDCLGKPILDFISEDDRDIIINKFKNKPQVTNEHYEFKLLRKDGSHLWVISSAKSLFDEDGKLAGSLSMLTDITRKKEAEIELMNTEIARKKEIHHRIKNNLQVISSLLDLQADKFRNRKNIKNSEMLEAFKESQDRVISMALIHEELHKGDGFEKLNFSPYVEELTANLLKTYSLGTKNISSKLNLDNNVFLDMDHAVPLGMIINELVSNSFKHAFKGRNEGEIQIKLHREETQSYLKSVSENSTGTTFVLTISDNGIGMPANLDIEVIDSLGLQLVSSLVTQLDGELEIKSNNGTEFIIRFTMKEKNNQMSLPVSSDN